MRAVGPLNNDKPRFPGLGLPYTWKCDKCRALQLTFAGSRVVKYRGAQIKVGACCAHLAPKRKRK